MFKKLFILLLLPFALNGQDTLKLNASFTSVNLAPYCAYQSDIDHHSEALKPVILDTALMNLNENELLFFDFGSYRKEIWLRLKLQGFNSTKGNYFLEINNSLIDELHYYHLVNGQIIDSNAIGDEIPFYSRPIAFRNPVYEINLRDGKVHTLLFKMVTDGRKFHVPMQLFANDTFITWISGKDLLFGFYYGLLGLMVILFTYLGFSIKDHAFTLFATYIFFLGLNQLTVSGVAYQYLWPNSPRWSNQSVPITMTLAILIGLIFGRKFLEHGKKIVWLDKTILTLIGLNLLIIVFVLLGEPWFSIGIRILYQMIPIFYILMLGLGIYYLSKKTYSARLFVPSFFLASVSIGMMTYYTMGNNTDNIFTNNLVIYVLILKCVVLALAMLDRFRIIKNEKELADKNLILQLEINNQFKENLNVVLEKEIQAKSIELEKKQQEVNWAHLVGEEKERQRLAKDLHDGMGSLLSSLKLHAQSINLDKKILNNQEEKNYHNLLEMIDQACYEIRTISHNLLPPGLEHFGLRSSLQALQNQMNQHAHLKMGLDILGMEEIGNKELELTIYRIVQELINNVVKHARAQNIHLQVVKRQDTIFIMVEDDGQGFEMKKEEKNGIGLSNIQSRVASLNGVFSIDSSLGNGTTIIIELPILI